MTLADVNDNQILDAIRRGGSYSAAARLLKEEYDLSTSIRTIRRKLPRLIGLMELENEKAIDDTEIDDTTATLAKQLQRERDTNRIERKTFRNTARLANSLEDQSAEIIRLLKTNALPAPMKYAGVDTTGDVLIVQFSDAHLNEIIDLEGVNDYDFNVAAARMYKYAVEVVTYAKRYGIRKCVFASTGDILNSDRHMDEMIDRAMSRGQAQFVAAHLMAQFLHFISPYFDEIKVPYVVGNESRMYKEMGNSEIMVTDNYDWTIMRMLELMMERDDSIEFIHGDPREMVINVNERNILLIHGNQRMHTSQKGIQSVIGKYALNAEIPITFVLFGHIHSAYTSDFFSRSSSLSGANSYADKQLQFYSRASQNMHRVAANGDIHSIKVDLQSYNAAETFPIASVVDNYKANLDATEIHYL